MYLSSTPLPSTLQRSPLPINTQRYGKIVFTDKLSAEDITRVSLILSSHIRGLGNLPHRKSSLFNWSRSHHHPFTIKESLETGLLELYANPHPKHYRFGNINEFNKASLKAELVLEKWLHETDYRYLFENKFDVSLMKPKLDLYDRLKNVWQKFASAIDSLFRSK